MDRKTYMRELYDALSELVPGQERIEILRYYEEYFDDAGPEGEAGVIQGLGDPRLLAEKLAKEAGYEIPAAEPVPAEKGRTRSGLALKIVGILAILIVALAALFCISLAGKFGSDVPAVEPAPGIDMFQGTAGISGESFRKIEVEAPVANVIIQTGEDFSVELEWLDDGQYTLNYSISRDALRVTGRPNSVDGHTDTRVLITVPSGTVLSEIDIEVGLGDVTVEDVVATDFNCDVGMGDLTWNGSLVPDMELNTGMGDVRIATDTIDGWECELTTGLGEVQVNGADENRSFRQEGRFGDLSAASGMGDITLTATSGK